MFLRVRTYVVIGVRRDTNRIIFLSDIDCSGGIRRARAAAHKTYNMDYCNKENIDLVVMTHDTWRNKYRQMTYYPKKI